MRNILIINNPFAGTRSVERHIDLMISQLRDSGAQVTLEETTRSGYLAEKYKGLQLPYTDIIICGGDGTINDAINAFSISEHTFCIYPVGSGNDFYKTAFGEIDHAAIRERIVKNETRRIDIGKANDHYFLNSAGFGLDVFTLQAMKKLPYKPLQKQLYKVFAGYAVFMYKAVRSKFIIDGEEIVGDTLIAVANNGKYFGGGLEISPKSFMDDGLLDLVLLEFVPKKRLLKLFSLLMKGLHLAEPEVTTRKVKHMRIETQNPAVVQLDGELVEKTPVNIHVIKDGIKVIV